MQILLGISLIFFGAFLTETPLDYSLSLAALSGLIGLAIALHGYSTCSFESEDNCTNLIHC